jgi:beta-phosphoglucomutase-like phosphatase (HAD superfamily)
MDGVLIDARKWHYLALNEALNPFGFEITLELQKSIFEGLPTKTKLEILSNDFGLPRVLHPVISKLKQDKTLRLAAMHCYPNVSHQILLERIMKLGLKIGLYTNSIRETTNFMLTYAKIIQFLDEIVTNEDVLEPKPNPEGYIKICHDLGFDPVQVLVIEDGMYGIQAAKNAGCKVIEVSGPDEVNIGKLMQYIPDLVSNND